MEVRGRTPLIGQIMPFSWVRVLTILAIILTIFASPVVSIQRVSGQSIGGNITGLQEGAGTNGADTNAAGQTSIGGDGTNLDANGGQIQESAVNDGPTNGPQGAAIEDEAIVQANQEPSIGSSVVEDVIPLDETVNSANTPVLLEEYGVSILEGDMEKRGVTQAIQGSILLPNLTEISPSANLGHAQDSGSITEEDVTAHLSSKSDDQGDIREVMTMLQCQCNTMDSELIMKLIFILVEET